MNIFFGTSHRSASFLEQAIKNGLKIDLVVSDPPKPIGKKQVLTENPTVTIAKKLNILFIATDCHSSALPAGRQESWNLYRSQIKSGMTIGIILDYNKIIPNEIIDLFPKGIINIHFSKLPKYRGPAPVQYTILNGDKEAWITYYLIAEKLDAGKIITQTSLPLDLNENTEDLYQKLITKAANEISQVIDEYLSGKLKPRLQEGTVTYTKKLTLENCRIDWAKAPQEIDQLIRAAYPEPTAWTEVNLQGNSTHPSSRVPPMAGSSPPASEFAPPANDPACHAGIAGRLQCRAGRRRSRAGDPFPFAGERDSSTPPTYIGVGRNDKLYRLKILKAHLEDNKLILDQVQLEGKKPVSWKQLKEGYPKAEIIKQKQAETKQI